MQPRMSPPPSHWAVIAAVVKPAVNNFNREAAATLIIPSSSPAIGCHHPSPSTPSPIHLFPSFVDCYFKPSLRLLHCCCSQQRKVAPIHHCCRPSLSIFAVRHRCRRLIVSLPFYFLLNLLKNDATTGFKGLFLLF